jgi:hypothetical protein
MNMLRRVGAFFLGFFALGAVFSIIGSLSEPSRFYREAPISALLLFLLGWGAWKLWVPLKPKLPDTSVVDETVAFFEHVNTTRAFPLANTDRVIDRPDAPVLAACNSRLFEITSTAPPVRMATRLKIGNVPIYLAPNPVRKDKLKESGAGELAITNKEIVFSSPSKTISIRLDKIVAIDQFRDGIQVSAGGRAKPLLFVVPNGILWSQLVKNLINLQVNGRSLPPGSKLDFM